jgi:hypothetical protein
LKNIKSDSFHVAIIPDKTEEIEVDEFIMRMNTL